MTRLIPAKYKSYISPWQIREWVGSKRIHGKLGIESNGISTKERQKSSIKTPTKKGKARRTV